MDYQRAIDCILSFKRNFQSLDIQPEKKEKVPKKLVSELGELYVIRELLDHFENVVPHGGQGKYDIKVGDRRIEVKTSLLKNDGLYDKHLQFWGWTVKRVNQKDTKKFDYLVGVPLDENWGVKDFYIFTYDEAYSQNPDVIISRYPSIQKKIHIFQNEQDRMNAKEASPNEVTDLEKDIIQNADKYRNRWNKIQRE
jgi:hypothetical protein